MIGARRGLIREAVGETLSSQGRLSQPTHLNRLESALSLIAQVDLILAEETLRAKVRYLFSQNSGHFEHLKEAKSRLTARFQLGLFSSICNADSIPSEQMRTIAVDRDGCDGRQGVDQQALRVGSWSLLQEYFGLPGLVPAHS